MDDGVQKGGLEMCMGSKVKWVLPRMMSRIISCAQMRIETTVREVCLTVSVIHHWLVVIALLSMVDDNDFWTLTPIKLLPQSCKGCDNSMRVTSKDVFSKHGTKSILVTNINVKC